MKIIAIGRNYLEHAKELNNPVPAEPVVFLMPDTCILNNNKPFYYPDFSHDIHHEIEIVLKINRVGKCIDPRFAHRYFSEVTVGVDFTARDIQKIAKEKGLPWEKAKAFDGSAPLGKFVEFEKLPDSNCSLCMHGNHQYPDSIFLLPRYWKSHTSMHLKHTVERGENIVIEPYGKTHGQ